MFCETPRLSQQSFHLMRRRDLQHRHALDRACRRNHRRRRRPQHSSLRLQPRPRRHHIRPIRRPQGRRPALGGQHLRHVLRRLLQPAHLIQRQRQHDHYPHHHHHPLHDIGPHHRVEAAVGGIDHHHQPKNHQTQQVLRINSGAIPAIAHHRPQRQGQLLKGVHALQQRLQDQTPRLALRYQVECHKKHDQRRGHQPEGRALKAVAQYIGHGDCAGDSRHLIYPLADQAHHADRHHHIAADPQRQHPAVAVDLGGKTRKAAARGASGGKGQRKGPHAQRAAA